LRQAAAMPHVPPIRPAPPNGPFTMAQAHDLGYSSSAIRCAISAGRWLRLERGVFLVRAESDDSVHQRRRHRLAGRAIAAQLTCAGSTVSHTAAAVLHGLPTYREPERPCLTVSPGASLRVKINAHLHRATLAPEQLREVDGALVTSVARTVLDIAREQGIDAAVVTGDAALNARAVTADQLDEALAGQLLWPGRLAAARTVELITPGSESPLDSLSRLRMADWGLPPPTLQQQIGDNQGWFLGRVDFYWDEFGVVGEADGEAKYDGLDAVLAEKRRQSRLLETGLQVVRWGWRDLRRFDLVAARLRSAFQGGRPVGSGRGWSLLNEP
jgi:hypothetical protein